MDDDKGLMAATIVLQILAKDTQVLPGDEISSGMRW
jgi:hypothetical protein